MDSIQKEKFGITEYANSCEGFFGILKQRFSDFHVNEISSSGEIIHLTSEEIIPIPSPNEKNLNIERPHEIRDDQLECLKTLSGKHQEVKPVVFLEKTESGKDYEKAVTIPKNLTEVNLEAEELTKERRTILHKYITSQFPELNSSTKEHEGKKMIHVTKKCNQSKKDRRTQWPKSQRYVTFALYKENIDTIDAVNLISSKLRLKPGFMCFAGTKDRRAKTTQLVSCGQVDPKNISSAVKSIWKINVGNFFYKHIPQKLGQSLGNHFRIALREVTASDETVNAAVERLKETGFINYFGEQRFGSTAIPTHTIGRAILQGKWERAVELILAHRENDHHHLTEAKKEWFESRNAGLALKKLKYKRSSIEAQLLNGLARNGTKNYVNSIDNLARNTKLMYIHAYQSYIWNNVLSRRVKKYGLKVLPGDIWKKKKNINDENDIDMDDLEEEAVESTEKDERKDQKVQFISEEEAKSADISQILLPLPGYNMIYPDNEIKGWYQEYLDQDGFSLDNMRHKVKSFSLGGAYRHVVVIPQSFSHSHCHYDDPKLSLIQSDIEAMKEIGIEENKLPDGNYKALLVEFSLPTSAYATMALRELLKMETSSKHQSSLNSINNAEQKRKAEDMGEEGGDKKIKIDDDNNT